jgi:phage terminase small subunit
MAGVKGRSGGPRPNSGGKRPGAGRKRKANPEAKPNESANPAPNDASDKDKPSQEPDPVLRADGTVATGPRAPLVFLEDVLNMPGAPLKDRIRAAIAAAQYRHTKRHDGGKKDEQADKADKAAQGRFAARPAPPALSRVK